MSAKRHAICNGTAGWDEAEAAAYIARLVERRGFTPSRPRTCCGQPGTELKRLLEWFGVKENAKCNCKDRVRQMNRWGPDGCRKNLDLICSWLQEEAWKRGIPMTYIILRPIVLAAISKAEGDKQPDPA
jgi:hypothetical protein